MGAAEKMLLGDSWLRGESRKAIGRAFGKPSLVFIASWPLVLRRPVETTSKSGQTRAHLDCPLSATSGLMHRSKQHPYSITSSALVSSVGGTVMPSVCAVLRLITSSYLVGAPTNGLRVDIFVGY